MVIQRLGPSAKVMKITGGGNWRECPWGSNQDHLPAAGFDQHHHNHAALGFQQALSGRRVSRVFDIGIGEIFALAAIGLLIFGPDKLPKAAADGARMLKQLRSMASGAKQELADSAGLDITEAMDTVRGFSEFHPKNIVSSILKDEPAQSLTQPASNTPKFDPDAT